VRFSIIIILILFLYFDIFNLETFLAPNSNQVQPTQEYHSISLPIDCRISIKLKNKIWNDEYIDFGSLLSNPMSDNKFQLSFSSSDAGLPPSLSVEPISKAKKITHISGWMNAFLIFVGVYAQKYPHESPALMKYGDGYCTGLGRSGSKLPVLR
jgi:hypothetical protein